jgi:hypothetical protein
MLWSESIVTVSFSFGMARIFVSSTFVDLKECRESVFRAIRKAGHQDIAMEYYVAEDKRPVDRCLRDVRSSDLYIGVFAWRYGWIPAKNNRRHLSITEMEYREALKSGKPCLIFLLDSSVPWPPDWIDDDRTSIKRLRSALQEKHGADPFCSAAELGQCAAHAIHKWALRSISGALLPDQAVHPGSLQYLDAPTQLSSWDDSAVEVFRELLRPECQHELPTNLEPQDFLERNGLVVERRLTRAAALLFCVRPDTVLPSAYLHCSSFDSDKRLKPRASLVVRGTAANQITEAINFVRRSTNHVDHFVEGLGRTVRFDEFPMVCLREILANAVCHRDYSDTQRNVHLRVFADRVEILSPGSWMGGRPLHGRTGLSVARSESIARNATLAKLLSWVKFVEREGSGLSRALADCVSKDAPEPYLEERDGFVSATIFPSITFDRVKRGEGPRLAHRSKEIVKAAEEEQLAYLMSQGSESDKLDALAKYAISAPRSAHRLLAQLDGISAESTLSFLRDHAGWDGELLRAYVSRWIGQGRSDTQIFDLLLTHTSIACDPVVLAFAYYALRGNRVQISRADFFRRFWRPMPAIVSIQTELVSTNEGPIRFMMGSDTAGDEQPIHEVELAPYRIGVTPVTCQEFGVFVGRGSDSTVPVVNVTWWESWIFCKWLGGKLPTEAQWECACRADTTSKWWCGNEETRLRQAAWVDEGDDGEAHPVRQKAPNPWGLFDVHGNVSEWCFDRYGSYLAGRSVDPIGPASGATRVLRGGNAAAPPDWSRSARRDHADPLTKSLVTGFRIVLGEGKK